MQLLVKSPHAAFGTPWGSFHIGFTQNIKFFVVPCSVPPWFHASFFVFALKSLFFVCFTSKITYFTLLFPQVPGSRLFHVYYYINIFFGLAFSDLLFLKIYVLYKWFFFKHGTRNPGTLTKTSEKCLFAPVNPQIHTSFTRVNP